VVQLKTEYELVQRGVLKKHGDQQGARRPDQILHEALTNLREAVPWDWIVDETRSLEDYIGRKAIIAGSVVMVVAPRR
jgi:hypothetical protein